MTIISVPLQRILPNPWQTRQTGLSAVLQAGSDDYIAELAKDIHTNGLLQKPLARVVKDGKPLSDQETYNPGSLMHDHGEWQVQLVFGHNRLAAFQKLHGEGYKDFDKMPVELRDVSDVEMADLAWAENERRRDHTPMDRALAIHKRIHDFGWTHEQVAEHLQVSRSAVTNALRLL